MLSERQNGAITNGEGLKDYTKTCCGKRNLQNDQKTLKIVTAMEELGNDIKIIHLVLNTRSTSARLQIPFSTAKNGIFSLRPTGR